MWSSITTGYGANKHFPPSWFNRDGSGDVKGELAGLSDFNHDEPDVLDYFINNIEEWITGGNVTNIRMDTVKHVDLSIFVIPFIYKKKQSALDNRLFIIE